MGPPSRGGMRLILAVTRIASGERARCRIGVPKVSDGQDGALYSPLSPPSCAGVEMVPTAGTAKGLPGAATAPRLKRPSAPQARQRGFGHQGASGFGQAAAIRRMRRMQPVGGPGDKLFPPTYPGEGQGKPPPRHVFEYRRIGNDNRLCVLIDRVQSHANRMEDALSRLRAQGG